VVRLRIPGGSSNSNSNSNNRIANRRRRKEACMMGGIRLACWSLCRKARHTYLGCSVRIIHIYIIGTGTQHGSMMAPGQNFDCKLPLCYVLERATWQGQQNETESPKSIDHDNQPASSQHPPSRKTTIAIETAMGVACCQGRVACVCFVHMNPASCVVGIGIGHGHGDRYRRAVMLYDGYG
jgi:hypothetical protein